MNSLAKKSFRKTLAQEAITAATALRRRLGLDQHASICVYDACQDAGVTVRFNDINMEGMYQNDVKPVVHISVKRPFPRRVFTCGHELGHHEFGHGSSIDELKESAQYNSWENPNEILADTFSAHLLMPAIGIRGALNKRSIQPERASPEQLYVIACDFSVGFQTLVTHLQMGLEAISFDRAEALKKVPLNKIRASLLGTELKQPLIVAGPLRGAKFIDMEVDSLLLVPKGTITDTTKLQPLGNIKNGSLLKATQPGITRIKSGEWSSFVRASRKDYVGLARYRHLEE